MIVRVKPSAAVERILKRTDEDPEDSPMEFLDQKIEMGFDPNVISEIPDETQEKDLEKQKSRDKIKQHHVVHTTTVAKGEINHGKANDSGLERN